MAENSCVSTLHKALFTPLGVLPLMENLTRALHKSVTRIIWFRIVPIVASGLDYVSPICVLTWNSALLTSSSCLLLYFGTGGIRGELLLGGVIEFYNWKVGFRPPITCFPLVLLIYLFYLALLIIVLAVHSQWRWSKLTPMAL